MLIRQVLETGVPQSQHRKKLCGRFRAHGSLPDGRKPEPASKSRLIQHQIVLFTESIEIDDGGGEGCLELGSFRRFERRLATQRLLCDIWPDFFEDVPGSRPSQIVQLNG